MTERLSIKILEDAAALQRKKSADYQNPNSTVTQADYYPNGVSTIQDIIWGKILRAKSLIEGGQAANFESLEDTYLDIINYASFAVAYLKGGVPGQDFAGRDAFNKPRPPVFPEMKFEAMLAEQRTFTLNDPQTVRGLDRLVGELVQAKVDDTPCCGENRRASYPTDRDDGRPPYRPGASLLPINKTGVA